MPFVYIPSKEFEYLDEVILQRSRIIAAVLAQCFVSEHADIAFLYAVTARELYLILCKSKRLHELAVFSLYRSNIDGGCVFEGEARIAIFHPIRIYC